MIRRGACRLWAAAIDLVAPRICPGCFAPEPWCAACAATVADRPRRVALPAPLLDQLAAADSPVVPTYALARYSGPIRAAIIAGKERGRRDLPGPLGAALGAGLAALVDMVALPRDIWLVPAPTRPAAARQRGGDPVLAMVRHAARYLAARRLAVGVAPCLTMRRGTRDSVGLTTAARARNLARGVMLRTDGLPPPRSPVVLIDDVFTTGATAQYSLAVLHHAGLRPVGVLVLASAVPLT